MVVCETVLDGGRSAKVVVRIGDTVHRPPGARADFSRALLLLLEERGFTRAPRHLGFDTEGREVLTYLEGVVRHDEVEWTDPKLADLARLIRTYHDATAGSELAGDHEVVCHNDIAPWNVVLRGDEVVGLIDFDDAAPGSRVDDLGYAIWTFLRLGNPDTPVQEQLRRIRAVCAAYGDDEHVGLINAIESQQRRVLAMREALSVTAATWEARDFSSQAAIRVRSELGWTRTHRAMLQEAIEDHAI